MKMRLLFSAALIGVMSLCANAESDNTEFTFEENIALPVVSQKTHNSIVRHQERIAKAFAKHDLETRSERNGEVVCVTVPCSMLFGANQTELLPDASKVLNAFNALLKLPALYKILMVVHADDTGDETYADFITEERANAIDAYYLKSLGDNLNFVPYAMGNDMPRTANNSIVGRAANRRVEFYIVPERQTVDMAKAGKL